VRRGTQKNKRRALDGLDGLVWAGEARECKREECALLREVYTLEIWSMRGRSETSWVLIREQRATLRSRTHAKMHSPSASSSACFDVLFRWLEIYRGRQQCSSDCVTIAVSVGASPGGPRRSICFRFHTPADAKAALDGYHVVEAADLARRGRPPRLYSQLAGTPGGAAVGCSVLRQFTHCLLARFLHGILAH